MMFDSKVIKTKVRTSDYYKDIKDSKQEVFDNFQKLIRVKNHDIISEDISPTDKEYISLIKCDVFMKDDTDMFQNIQEKNR